MTTRWVEETGSVLERDLAIVRSAIGLVARHGAPRVLVAGLHSGDELLRAARSVADQAGVRIVAIPGGDAEMLDLEVEDPAHGRAAA
jgi:hypothetical protein